MNINNNSRNAHHFYNELIIEDYSSNLENVLINSKMQTE